MWTPNLYIFFISLTQDGRIRVGDVRKISKAMDWGETQSFGAMELGEPVLLFAALLERGGLLEECGLSLVVADSAGADGSEPPAETLRRLVLGFATSDAWGESAAGTTFRWGYANARLPQLRLALLVAFPVIVTWLPSLM